MNNAEPTGQSAAAQPTSAAGERFSSPQGEAYRQAELAECAAVVSNIFGYHALQLSIHANASDLVAAAQVISRHRLLVDHTGALNGDVIGAAEALPFAADSVQLAVVQHAHQWPGWQSLLEQIERLLSDGGVLVLCSLRDRSLRAQEPVMAKRGLRHEQRVLQQLGFRVLLTRPVLGGSAGQRLLARADRLNMIPGGWLAPLASGYLLIAQKNSRLAPIMRVGRRRLISGRLSQSATG